MTIRLFKKIKYHENHMLGVLSVEYGKKSYIDHV